MIKLWWDFRHIICSEWKIKYCNTYVYQMQRKNIIICIPDWINSLEYLIFKEEIIFLFVVDYLNVQMLWGTKYVHIVMVSVHYSGWNIVSNNILWNWAFSVSFVWLLFNIKWEVFQYSCQRILDKYTLAKTDGAIKNEQWTQTTYGTIHRTKTNKTKHRKLYIRYLSWIVRVLAHWKNSHLFCRTISFLVGP